MHPISLRHICLTACTLSFPLFLASCGGMHPQYSKMAHSPAFITTVETALAKTDHEVFQTFEDNPVIASRTQPISTFSIDVDTGSYTITRRDLMQGRLPRRDAVRAEEFINYFDFEYPTPKTQDMPFAVSTEISQTPWNKKTHLLKIGLKGYDKSNADLPPSNLVFLLDVSGSMLDEHKLPLLKKSLALLTQKLRPIDRISIVVYAGASGIVLEPTPGHETGKILAALEGLSAGGSTNGGAGIQLAYALAQQAFIKGGINRIILATDGDFNVGSVNFEALKNLVQAQQQSGIALTTLGFGRGNYNDHLMEQLADAGNGNYAYIDTLLEAKKVLLTEMSSTFFTIAKDVKVQIEFNPKQVAEYRLIGYENRVLQAQDFRNDKVDAGDIGAGHSVTAFYEITLVGSQGTLIPTRRYAPVATSTQNTANASELAFLKLRFKQPEHTQSQLKTWVIQRSHIQSPDNSSDNYRFAAAVAAFAQHLRGGQHLGHYTYEDIIRLAKTALGADQHGLRHEFIRLVDLAQNIEQKHKKPSTLK